MKRVFAILLGSSAGFALLAAPGIALSTPPQLSSLQGAWLQQSSNCADVYTTSRQAVDKYRTRCTRFVSNQYGGHDLLAKPNASAIALELNYCEFLHNNRQVEMTVAQAKNAMSVALQKKRVTATGTRNGEHREIDAISWRKLQFFQIEMIPKPWLIKMCDTRKCCCLGKR